MSTLNITQGAGSISLTIDGISEAAADKVKERVIQIESMLAEILQFDEVIANLDPDDFSAMQQALAAMDLKYRTVLEMARAQAMSARLVADGTDHISDHGFPEFGYE